ncbi:MAG: hypothetical protein L6R39_006456 [Caloplaca ligustica]|nr:MAG: hypothetical protein L6R39_006456 [Caloplaca ligustica]
MSQLVDRLNYRHRRQEADRRVEELGSIWYLLPPPSALAPDIESVAANLVLQDTIERIFIENLYADISRGIFLVRGENVLLLGEIDLDKDDHIPEPFCKASAEEVHALTVRKNQAAKRSDKVRQTKLQELGFEAEHSGEVLF